MKLYAPRYYKTFKCIAGECTHSCCIGWEIDIDKETLKKYKALKGGCGKTVLDTVCKGKEPHFILGDGERCPHLNSEGLCEIIINLGEEYLCDICREHPRFYSFTDVCEVGIGLSCEEAAKIVLSSSDYDLFEEIGTVSAEPDGVEFDGRGERTKIYEILANHERSYALRLEKICNEYRVSLRGDSEYLEIIDNLEYLVVEHKKLFLSYSSAVRPSTEVNQYLERFLAYLIFRHASEAYDEDDFCARLAFCLFGERLLASLICSQGAKTLGDVSILARIISEEIEYSSDNTDALIY